eukprot:GFYU01034608.1.p1 GENE.GFYU01034608.1~~GFYU01034608.1.p1  ORF type:complete len:505 (+),score=148.19 GFYU01034608.1:126-1640(+)
MALSHGLLAAVVCLYIVVTVPTPANAKQNTVTPHYDITPLTDIEHFGARVNVDAKEVLASPHAAAIVSNLLEDLHKYKILLLPAQTFTWQEQIQFGELFGPLYDESSHVNRKKWKGEKDARIAIFSNHPDYGAVNVGTEGWHVDGNVAAVPHKATMIFGERAIVGGDTLFVPLNPVLRQVQPPDILDGVYFRSAHVKDVIHPIVYPHPTTGVDTMVFGLGSLSGKYMRGDKEMSEEETADVIRAIEKAIDEVGYYRHKWTSGDLMILDNLGAAHLATSGTQNKDAGIRVMRRVTIAGTNRPSKRPDIATLPEACTRGGATVMVSLATHVDYSNHTEYFSSMEDSRRLCRVHVHPYADLATLENPEKAAAAKRLVATTGQPHWLRAREEHKQVTWLDNTESSGSVDDTWGNRYPWHDESGQPNDCDGPQSEPCLFVGAHGKWFDFACQAKTPSDDGKVTAGPEITWDDGSRRMYRIYPLCEVSTSAVGDVCGTQARGKAGGHDEL